MQFLTDNWLVIAKVLAVVLGGGVLFWPAIKGMKLPFTSGSGKPTRDDAVKAYDVLAAYLETGSEAELAALWPKLRGKA